MKVGELPRAPTVVAQVCNLLYRRFLTCERPAVVGCLWNFESPADLKSAIQQVANLRYVRYLRIGLLISLWAANPAWGATNVISGALPGDATWSGTNNVVQGTVVVPPGVVLTIEPATRVMLDAAATLVVRGQLLAQGTESQPIHFTRYRSSGTWGRIQFIGAADSRLEHCVIEYANSAGSHLDYYDNDCNPATAPPARNYHEAVVIIGTHVNIEGCVFQNLPNNTGSREGDAIAVISDDPQNPGIASARIFDCRFLSIGQGVHTRFSYVLVENCFFTGHNGDNDDVDLYGESMPPPLIRNNVFLNPNHDDMINPTRCSAVIVGNVISGSDDHGIVLRDQCAPIVANNLIYNCSSAGIAVQNQCDALLVNNTIANCGRGVRFFDHTGRWGPPYCLNPGSGKATVVNCLIWNCPTPFELADSPYPEDRGSHATVLYSNIQNGRTNASVSANSTLTWGDGNFSSNPLLTAEYRLRPGSPCIDRGTNSSAVATNLGTIHLSDLDGNPRPLDGDGNGSAAFDIGAHEFLLAAADSNGDGIPDGWTSSFGLDPVDPAVAAANPDHDPQNTFEEWLADTDPTNALSYLRIDRIAAGAPVTLHFLSSSNRQYTLYYSPNVPGALWTPVPGQVNIAGRGGADALSDTNAAPDRFYRIGAGVP